jgi:hypothetical protein
MYKLTGAKLLFRINMQSTVNKCCAKPPIVMKLAVMMHHDGADGAVDFEI